MKESVLELLNIPGCNFLSTYNFSFNNYKKSQLANV